MKANIAAARRALWAAALAAAVGLTWLAFHGYQHPELLLGVANLRYCN